MGITFIPDEKECTNPYIRSFFEEIKKDCKKDLTIIHSKKFFKKTRPLFVHKAANKDDLIFNINSNDIIVLSDDGIFVIKVLRGLKIENNTFYSLNYDAEANQFYEKISNPFDDCNHKRMNFYNYLKRSTDKKGMGVGFGVALTMVDSFEVKSIGYNDENIYIAKGDIPFDDFIVNLANLSRKLRNNEINDNSLGSSTTSIAETYDSLIEKVFELMQIKPRGNNGYYMPSEYQMEVLDSLESNDGAIIHGAAGTGKTDVAIDLYKRLSDNGERVKYFTFNELLCDKVKKIARNHYPQLEIDCDYLNSFYIKHCKNTRICPEIIDDDFNEDLLPQSERNQFYNYTLPKLMVKAINKSEEELKFDAIIIDQAQDIITPTNLMLLSLILDKRICGGKWYFFGDFETQIVFSTFVYKDRFKEYIKGMSSMEFLYIKLMENYRSAKKIIFEMNKLTHDNIKSYNEEEGIFSFIDYDGNDELVSKLDHLIDELLQKYDKKSITILTNSNCDENELLNLDYFKILKHRSDINYGCQDEYIQLAKIRRYKGIENDVIILVDLNEFIPRKSTEPSKNLYYTAISRARNEVYIFQNNKDKKAIEHIYDES